MRIIAISDIHEQWNSFELPAGDVLVIAGDLCERADKSFSAANNWFETVAPNYQRALYVPGNHDQPILQQPGKYRSIAPSLLRAMVVDVRVELEGLTFHCTPWETGGRENPEAAISEGIDVLVTHDPPYGVRDWAPRLPDSHIGNRALRHRIESVVPRLHIFGHCHMAFGCDVRERTTFVNVAICGDPKKYYRAWNPATIIDIDSNSIKVTQRR